MHIEEAREHTVESLMTKVCDGLGTTPGGRWCESKARMSEILDKLERTADQNILSETNNFFNQRHNLEPFSGRSAFSHSGWTSNILQVSFAFDALLESDKLTNNLEEKVLSSGMNKDPRKVKVVWRVIAGMFGSIKQKEICFDQKGRDLNLLLQEAMKAFDQMTLHLFKMSSDFLPEGKETCSFLEPTPGREKGEINVFSFNGEDLALGRVDPNFFDYAFLEDKSIREIDCELRQLFPNAAIKNLKKIDIKLKEFINSTNNRKIKLVWNVGDSKLALALNTKIIQSHEFETPRNVIENAFWAFGHDVKGMREWHNSEEILRLTLIKASQLAWIKAETISKRILQGIELLQGHLGNDILIQPSELSQIALFMHSMFMADAMVLQEEKARSSWKV